MSALVRSGVNLGDLVFGVPDYIGQPTGGAAEFAVLRVFLPVPEGLTLTEAAVLPMAVETATRSIDLLGPAVGRSLMVNGGGTMTGFAAVQIALLRGVHVKIVGGDPRRVFSFADRDEEGIGVRTAWKEQGSGLCYDVLGHCAQLAAEGRFSIPVARTFPLEDWREAAEISIGKRTHGKLVLLPDRITNA